MPISARCPACAANLTAPDAAAGKVIKCPGCGTRVELPPPDDDEDAVETVMIPAKKKRPKRRDRAEMSVLVPVLVGVGAVVLVAAILGAVLLWPERAEPVEPPPTPATTPTPVSSPPTTKPEPKEPEWVNFADPGGRFTVPLPVQPVKKSAAGLALIGGGGEIWEASATKAGTFRVATVPVPADLQQLLPLDQIYATLGPALAAAVARPGSGEPTTGPVTVAGKPGVEFVYPLGAAVRVVLLGDALVALSADGPGAKRFFDGFRAGK